MVHSLPVPGAAREAGFDHIRFHPYRGDGRGQLGHVLLED